MGDRRRAVGWMVLLVGLSAAPLSARATELESLREQVAREPGNIDARLRMAALLSWEGALGAAEKEAATALKMAPERLDARLLLARITGWEGRFAEALTHVDAVLQKAPTNPEALLLKLDILIWSKAWRDAEDYLSSLAGADIPRANLDYRAAQVYLGRHRYLSAYRRAKQVLESDPTHEEALAIVRDTRRVTLFATHELEYYGFKGEEAKPDRFGYGLSLAGKLFSGARFSAALLETSRYRYRTVNNQVGLELAARPLHRLDLILRGLLGAPAKVVPRAQLLAGFRVDLLPWMDASVSYGLDRLTWPAEEPAWLHRPAVALHAFVHRQVRVGGAYTLGLLTYCARSPVVNHAGRFDVKWIGQKISVEGFYSYGQETDPFSIGAAAPVDCEEIAAVEAAQESGEATAVGFGLTHLHIHTGGLSLFLDLTRQLTLVLGYQAAARLADSNDLVIPAHTAHLGMVTWF